MSDSGFDRTYLQFWSMFMEDFPNCLSFHQVVKFCSGSMGIDVIHFSAGNSRGVQGGSHGHFRPLGIWIRFCLMKSIITKSITENFCIYMSTSLLRGG